MRVCQDLPAGFVGIGSEKSIDVAVRDSTPPLRPKSYEASNVIERQFCGCIVERWGSRAVEKWIRRGLFLG